MPLIDFIREIMSSKFKPCVFVILLAIFILFFIGVYEIFALILPNFIALPINILFFFGFFYILALFLIFPGSFWLWRRHLENQFSKAISNKSLVKMKQLKSIIEYLLHKNRGSEAKNILKDELIEIQKMINSYVLTFQTMETQKTITKKQKILLENIIALQTCLKETRLKTNGNLNENSLWDWMDNSGSFLFLLKDQVSTFEFEKIEQGEEILMRCQFIENVFENLIQKHWCLKNLYFWLFNNTLGTIDQMRVELENRFKTKKITLKTFDNKDIDCILIYSNSEEIKKKLFEEKGNEQSSTINENSEMFSNDPTLTGPVMIFCNPNAGYYEYMYYESDWIEFYCKNGVSLFLWNYRGYGRSKGCPNPIKLQKDGELIVEYLRKDLKAQKIGVHGQSLGGLLACHLAYTCNLDFLCADRTFYSFSDIVNFSFSAILAMVFKVISNWNENNASKFTKSQCYKVVTYDPKDEIINYMSSLQAGILKEVIYDRVSNKITGIELHRKDNASKLNNFLQKMQICLKNKRTIIKNDQQLLKDFNTYYESYYFTNDEFNALFNAFFRVMEVIVEMSKHKSTFKKMHRRFLSSDDGQLEKMRQKNKEQQIGILSAGNTGSLDSSLNVTTNISVLNISHFKEESISNANDLSLNKSIMKEDNSVLFNNIEEENEEAHKQQRLELKVPVPEPNDYIDLLTDKEKNSEKFQTFILEVFSIFDSCDAGGVSLNDIFLNYRKSIKHIFKMFFVSLELWGSYNPIKMIAKKKMVLPLHQKFSLTKLKDFLKKLEALLTNEKKSGFVDIVQQKVLHDLELIFYYFLQFYEKMQKGFVKHKESNQLMTSPHGDIQTTKIQISNKENSEILTLNDQELFSFMGNLIPLSCGHNGCFNKKESQIFEFHLRNSKFMEI